MCVFLLLGVFLLEFLLNVCVGGGDHYPGEFGVLEHPLKASSYRLKSAWRELHSPLGAQSFALKTIKLMRPRRPKQYCLQLVIYIYISKKRYKYIHIQDLMS